MAKTGTPWRMPLAVMEKPTGDGRMFDAKAIDHLALPLPFRHVSEDVGAHQQAHVVGRIDKIDYAGDAGVPMGTGVFFDGDDAPEGIRTRAAEAFYLAKNGVVGPSVDLDSSESEGRIYKPKQTLAQAAEQLACGCDGEQPHPVQAVTKARMRAATLVPIAAFAELAGQGQYGADLSTGGDPNVNAAETETFSIEEFVSIHEAADQAGLLAAGDDEFAKRKPRVVEADDEPDHDDFVGRFAKRKAKRTLADDVYGDDGDADSYAVDPNVGGGVDRAKLDRSDFIDPAGRRFPIVTPQDVHDAVASYGRAKPLIPLETFRERLTAIAHRKGKAFVDALPASWDAITAAGAPSVLDAPPDEWFHDPKLDKATPLTITDDGRVFGHLAAWGTCHTGIGDACITAPKTRTNYSYFHTGELVTASGKRIPVGRLTYGGGHARHHLGYAAAADHYDSTSAVGAYVRAGEDEHGIWVAGAMSPTATSSAYSTMRAAPLSGDWRRVAGNLELVAALHVNTAGFPIPRALAASGEPQALTSAGALVPVQVGELAGLPVDVAQVVRETLAQVRQEEADQAEQAQRSEAMVAAMVGLRQELHVAQMEVAEQAREELLAALASIGEE